MLQQSGPAAIAAPTQAPRWHVFHSTIGSHVLVVPRSRLYDLPGPQAAALEGNESWAVDALERAVFEPDEDDAMEAVPSTPPQSISLNVSASCNLACGYCYAGRGAFGGRQTGQMKWEAARAAVDQLLAVSDAGAPITIGFLGGEPFVNRRLIHRVVHYAARQADRLQRDIRFSVTTNGTLLTAADLALVRSHRFAVTVSVDGGAAVNDRQRPTATGGSSLALLQACMTPLLESPGSAKVAARVTVTRDQFDLQQRFDDLTALGFSEVGFSPVRSGGDSNAALRDSDWHSYLEELKAVARHELRAVLADAPIRMTNFAVALKQLHRGASMPYSCGAGGGYFSVASTGEWYACHRAIGQEDYRLGSNRGIDAARQHAFLSARHVHAQAPCRACWARYLCSGGCHQEASLRSDSACGFIRGWLDFCLQSYCELSHWKPQWFATPRRS